MLVSSKYYPSDEHEEMEERTEGPAWTSLHSKLLLVPGSEYEMTDRNGWHSVRPLGAPSDSLMVVGPLYKPRVEMPHAPIEKQQPLSPKRFTELFNMWHQRVHDMLDRIDAPVECENCPWVGRVSELHDCAEIYASKSKCPECGSLDVRAKGRR
jgi:hypothetical protein